MPEATLGIVSVYLGDCAMCKESMYMCAECVCVFIPGLSLNVYFHNQSDYFLY